MRQAWRCCCRACTRRSAAGHWPPRLDQALTRIDRLQPAAKSLLVKALVLAIAHDGRMTVAESELLRAICAVLHCPLPPLYPGDGRPSLP